MNRILDFSTPPKPTAANSSPLSLTPFKPLDTTQDKPAPNMNPFIDPSYPSKVSPDKQTVTSANEPSSPPHDPRSPKSRSDMQLFSLLSAGDAKQGKDLAKSASLSSTAKPLSTLLQSTNADSSTSPTKTTQLDESQTLNIQKTEEPSKAAKANELNESQTINIPANKTSPKVGFVAPSNTSQTSVSQGYQSQVASASLSYPEGDSEMQDDNEYGDAFQGITLGNQGNAKPTASNAPNPFAGKTSASAPIASGSLFSGVGQNNFAPPNLVPQTHPQGNTLFGGQANFGGTPNLFQGPSLLQGIGGDQPKLFAQTTSAPTFGSIASQNQSPQRGFGQQQPTFGQAAFGQPTTLFGGNQGQSQSFGGFGSMPPGPPQGFGGLGQAGQVFGTVSGSGATSEMKGKAFTSYRS